MKLAVRLIGALLVVVVVLFVGQILASESGEVVVVTTTDATGAQHETHLWIVETTATRGCDPVRRNPGGMHG